MNQTTQLMTADELFLLPKDGRRYELVKGEIRAMAPAGLEHGAVGMKLAAALSHFVQSNRLGIVTLAETGFVLSRDPDTVRAPDIAFLREERIKSGITQKYGQGAPDLAVEVVSPGDTVDEVDDKVQEWLNGGAQLVWVVSPKRKSVTVYRATGPSSILSAAETLDGGDTLPGFKIRVGDIFAQ